MLDLMILEMAESLSASMETTISALGPGALYMLVMLLLSLQGSPTGATDVITATQPLSGQ